METLVIEMDLTELVGSEVIEQYFLIKQQILEQGNPRYKLTTIKSLEKVARPGFPDFALRSLLRNFRNYYAFNQFLDEDIYLAPKDLTDNKDGTVSLPPELGSKVIKIPVEFKDIGILGLKLSPGYVRVIKPGVSI